MKLKTLIPPRADGKVILELDGHEVTFSGKDMTAEVPDELAQGLIDSGNFVDAGKPAKNAKPAEEPKPDAGKPVEAGKPAEGGKP